MMVRFENGFSIRPARPRARGLKRFQTRGRGRAAGIIKPFAHLTIVVRERAEAEEK